MEIKRVLTIVRTLLTGVDLHPTTSSIRDNSAGKTKEKIERRLKEGKFVRDSEVEVFSNPPQYV